MIVDDKIKVLINKLTSIHLTPGVQPSEISDAIFEDEYKHIELKKKNGVVQMTVKFIDYDGNLEIPVIMRYTYNLNKVLLLVEQKVDRCSFKVQWDRDKEIDSLLTEISRRLLELNNELEVDRVMNTIPKDLRTDMRNCLRLVA